MQTVFTNSMVAHVWAQQSQESGRSNNGQFFFEGRALYSYGRHYVAGYALPRPNGRPLFLINADSYSITTSRHCSEAYYAVPGAAFSVAGLTRLAGAMDSALDKWEYPKDSHGKTCPTPRRATAKERREALPQIKAAMLADWPGESVAAAILAAFACPHAESVAGAMRRKVERAQKAEAEAAAKRARDDNARAAKHFAAKTPAQMRAHISATLARYSGGDWAQDSLRSDSRHAFRIGKEAKARGWTQIAAKVARNRAMIRAALADIHNRQAFARRHSNRRKAIAIFRDSAAKACRLIIPRAEGGAMGEGAAATRGQWWQGLADSVTGLESAAGGVLRPATVARLRSIQSAALIKATEERKAANAERMAAEAEARADWLAGGKANNWQRLSDATGGALLRAVDVERDDSGAITGGTLETSHRASVPLTHALRVFAFLRHCRAAGQGWKANGRRLRVGHFAVDSVAPNGDFVAGCHRINFAEVARLAESLGVAELAPADTTEERATA